MAYSSSDIQKALADPGASGPGGIYNEIRASMGSSSGSSGGASPPAPSAPTPVAQTPVAALPSGEAVYNTVNGPRTPTQMMNELMAVGWNGQGEIKQKYAQTTGGAVTPSGQISTGGPGGVPGANVKPFDPSAILAQINSALGNFGAQASGVTQAELAERKRQFDLALEWQKQMWQNQGLPQLVIQQKAQELAEQEYQSQLQLAQAAQAMQESGLTGVYKGAPTLQAQQQAFAQEQARAGLGLQYLAAESQLGGPENVFQQSNFYRSAQGNPNVPAFLQALQSNTRMPVFQAMGNTAPTVLSAGSIANRLAGSGDAGFNPDQALATIQGISNRGAQGLSPGTLERLTPDELQAFGSGLKAVGNSLPAFLQQYAASRLGQSALTSDMSLAA